MCLNERILSYLERCPAGTYTALQIAKAVGLKTAKDVNGALYRLKEASKIHMSDDRPPLWSLQRVGRKNTASTSEVANREVTTGDLMGVLKSSDDGKGLTAGQIAKNCDQERKSVKRTLYELQSKGKVEKLTGKLWKLTVSGKDDSDSDFAEDPSEKTESGLSISRDFHLVKELGEGGFGCVCLVKHKMDGKLYAMKIVEYDRDAEREVRALAECEHQNIVRYFTAWPGEFDRKAFGLGSTSGQSSSDDQTSSEDEDSDYTSTRPKADLLLHSKSADINFRQEKLPSLFIQMEFCGNGTLHSWIEDRNSGKSQKSREHALEVFQQVVCGVEYIHSKGLIHRDLKPENILFANDGTAKIGDFGLVTSITNQNGAIMKRTVGKGTFSYMSPEQGKQKEYDEKTDIFPLGLICFEILWKISTGSERIAIWPDLRNQVFPSGFCEAYTSEHKLIRKMLSKSPEKRPAATEIADFINNFLLSGKMLNQKTV